MGAKRADLLALSADDLSTLSNRGLVKRAQKDLESGNGPAELEVADDGKVRAVWPDGAIVTLAVGPLLKTPMVTRTVRQLKFPLPLAQHGTQGPFWTKC
jgi:hypothetical protein